MLATEQLHMHALGLDARDLDEVTALLIEAQVVAAGAVQKAAHEIAHGARAMANTVRNGAIIHYVAAGSSGLMAAADALELGGTFSIAASQIKILMAGGIPTGSEMPGETEDDVDAITLALSELDTADIVIAVSASGSTPYTLQAAQVAKAAGATVIGIANNAPSPLLELADIAIALTTPPEVLSGSTRLGAGTAQKIALNSLSTAMAVELGHVHDGMMVNLRADNAKLRNRATEVITRIAAVEPARAHEALREANGEVKLAILMAAQTLSLHEARLRLARADGKLRAALARSE